MSGPPLPDSDPTAPSSYSVVMCTHTLDRWADIEAGLVAVHNQTLAPHEVVVVVDGNPELETRVRGEFPEVAVVPNTHRPGVSGARNSGLAAAKGQVVVFLDDDARPEGDWLERLSLPYSDPSTMAVGGAARPVWPRRRPDHLAPELDWIVGCTYEGHPVERANVRNLFGCNMSVRRDVVDRIGGFDESIGRLGLVPLGCDDTEFFIRLHQRLPQAHVVFEPTAVVHHRVTPARTTWAYLRSRSLAEGLSKAQVATAVGSADATSVENDYVRRVLVRGVLRELGRAVRGDPAGWSGAGGIVVCLVLAGAGFLRGRAGALMNR